MILAWYDPTNRRVSTDKNDPAFTKLGQLWPLVQLNAIKAQEQLPLDLAHIPDMDEAKEMLLRAADAIKAQADEIFRLKAAIYACLPSGMSEAVFEEAYKHE